ncbi:MAG: hypothetical protein IPH46_17795 [Bacteroidetes bacterium]|nr:hypothetical protein [Bacteroidota bacterium]
MRILFQLPSCYLWRIIGRKKEQWQYPEAVVKNGEVNILKGQDSYNLLAYADANAFALLVHEMTGKKKGDLIEVFNW